MNINTDNFYKHANGELLLSIDRQGIADIPWDNIRSVHGFSYKNRSAKFHYAYLIIHLKSDKLLFDTLSDKETRKIKRKMKESGGGVVLDISHIENDTEYKNSIDKFKGIPSYDRLFARLKKDIQHFFTAPLILFGTIPLGLFGYKKIIKKIGVEIESEEKINESIHNQNAWFYVTVALLALGFIIIPVLFSGL